MTASAGSWRLLPDLLVRTTGFSWDTLDALRCPRTRDAALTVVAAREEVERMAEAALRERHPGRALTARLREARQLRPGQVPDEAFVEAWNRRTGALASAETDLERDWAGEAGAVRERLRRIASDERFLAAIVSSSPPVYRDLAGGAQWSPQLERQVASYLQRLCAKNETSAFFGPINYAESAPGGPDGVTLRWSGPALVRARRTHAAAWLVNACARAIAFDPEILPWLVLRPKAFAGGRPGRASGGRREQLLAELDGATCAAQVARRLGWDLEELGAVAGEACEHGLATHQLEVPAAAPLPLHDLLRRTAAVPGPGAGRHLSLLGRLMELMDQYGPAGAARRDALGEETLGLVAGTLGVTPPARRERFYADHLPLREECAGDLALRVGGRRAEELLEWTAPGLELLAGTAARARLAARRRVASLLGPGSAPLWRVVARLRGEAVPRDTALQRRVAGWEAAGPGEIDLRGLDLQGLGCPDGETILG
ncbi:MAG TPA: hypothetical protein VGO86_17005, partial [Candidatus Dormibacteraeota bacterium]